jgi:hypothetical protein
MQRAEPYELAVLSAAVLSAACFPASAGDQAPSPLSRHSPNPFTHAGTGFAPAGFSCSRSVCNNPHSARLPSRPALLGRVLLLLPAPAAPSLRGLAGSTAGVWPAAAPPPPPASGRTPSGCHSLLTAPPAWAR